MWRRSSRRGVTDRPNAPRGTRVRPMLARGWPGWPLLGRCALPCAPCAWWLLHPVTVRSGAAGRHVETSCAACTNVSRRHVSAFGGVVQCRSLWPCAQPVGTSDRRSSPHAGAPPRDDRNRRETAATIADDEFARHTVTNSTLSAAKLFTLPKYSVITLLAGYWTLDSGTACAGRGPVRSTALRSISTPGPAQ